jgi:predicted  nucleic acid-binding Zn-ribbon protein
MARQPKLKTVDDDSLQRLLDLQSEDLTIKRLEERRSSLPEASRLEQVSAQLAELEADSEIARKQLQEVTREHGRLEGEIGIGEQKIQKEEQRLFSGAVSNPKELGALQAEVAMLKRKRGELEDQLLEVMLQKDDATTTMSSLDKERSESAQQAGALKETVAAIILEIDSELADHTTKRADIAATIPPDLLSLYERTRATKGGVGAAALIDSTCQGCHTRLPSKEAERLRAEKGLQRCDNCGRILVVK